MRFQFCEGGEEREKQKKKMGFYDVLLHTKKSVKPAQAPEPSIRRIACSCKYDVYVQTSQRNLGEEWDECELLADKIVRRRPKPESKEGRAADCAVTLRYDVCMRYKYVVYIQSIHYMRCSNKPAVQLFDTTVILLLPCGETGSCSQWGETSASGPGFLWDRLHSIFFSFEIDLFLFDSARWLLRNRAVSSVRYGRT